MNFYENYYTTNESVEMILKSIGATNDRKKESHHYRELISLAKEDKINYKKEGRRYHFNKEDIDKYIENIAENKKYKKEYKLQDREILNLQKEINNNDTIVREDNNKDINEFENLRNIIVSLEKANYGSEKILRVVKDILNTNLN